MIGLPHNIAVTKLTAKYLIETVHRLAQEAGRAVRPRERRSYRASFRTACARRLAERMAALRRHPSPSMAHSANGRSKLPALLSLYDAESRANEALLRELGIDLTRGALRDRLTHAGGAEAGRLAAETIPLHPQMGVTTSGTARARSRADVASGQLEMFC